MRSAATCWAPSSFAVPRAGRIVSAPRSSTCMVRAFIRPRWRGCRSHQGTAICFQWDGPIADAIVHLGRWRVPIDAGPIERFGAKGSGTRVYFRDPDGSLLEFISYHRIAGDHA